MRIGLNAQKLSFAQAYHSGGISRYTYHLLSELRGLPSPHQFTAFVPRVPDDPALRATPRFRVKGSGAGADQPLARILWEQLLLPARLLGRFDLVHGLAFALPLAWPGRSVVTIFDLSFLRYPWTFNPTNRSYLSIATRLSVRRAGRVLVISKHAGREVVELLGVPPERVLTTYCAADERFQPLPQSAVADFRARKELPERFILYLGTLEPRKNVATLIRSYARLRAAWPQAPRLVLVGGAGWLSHDLFRALDEAGLREHVRLTGYVPGDEQALWYNAATVFAYPSLYEGFGLPPLEAMACGTPVVASDASSLPEVVGNAGLMASPLDDVALAVALRRVLEDDALAADLRRAGLEQAARFSWRRMALETLRCYDELAETA